VLAIGLPKWDHLVNAHDLRLIKMPGSHFRLTIHNVLEEGWGGEGIPPTCTLIVAPPMQNASTKTQKPIHKPKP